MMIVSELERKEKNAAKQRVYRARNYEKCKALNTIQAGIRRGNNRDEYNSYMREYRRTPEQMRKRLFMEARYRAKKRGLEFTIAIDDISVPERCPIFDLLLVIGSSKGGPSDCSPTLDRIDSKLGYIKGNVWVVSGRANRIKNNASIAELKMMVHALEKLQIKPA